MRVLMGVCALALTLACPQATSGRSYTVEDLLATEALGQAQVDAHGRWAVVERQRPWREVSDYSYGGLTPMLLSELWIADLKSGGPLVRLVPSAPDTGYFAGPLSRDGSQVMVYRLRGARLEAGVARLADKTIAWTGRTPELPVFGRAAQWTPDGKLLVLTTGENRLPYHLASRRTVQDELPGRWREAAQGQVATRSAIGSMEWAEGSGRSNQKRAPSPGVASQSSFPPISSTSSREMARPRPVPPKRRVMEPSAC